MQTAKLFVNGHSQAVRLPKDCQFKGKEVFIKKMGRSIILIPKDSPWESLINSLSKFSEDFLSERDQPAHQIREDLE